MILDNLLLLSGAVSAAGVLSGQAVAGTDTSVLSTNTLDTGPLALGGNQPSNLGAGEDLKLAFSVLTAPTVGTSVQFQLIQADDAALTSNVQVINQTGAIPIASLPAGTLVPLDYGDASLLAAKRYIGVRYVLVGAIASMVVTAAIVKDVASVKNMLYKSGYLVS
jgi:hypothetical protein